MNRQKISRILFPILAICCLLPGISAGVGLLIGIVFALVFENPFVGETKKYTSLLLQLAVIGLGAGMNLKTVLQVGAQGIGYTVLGISFAFLIGFILKKLLHIEKNVSLLITVGTAICGGSAIAAVAPVIQAKDHEVSVAMGTVFFLNAVALFLFPWVGHSLHLSKNQFGLWSALAIHDTSSVVGATLQYGAHALEVGTTVKLARALWIVPIALLIGRSAAKAKRPWFILGFLAMAALVTFFPDLQGVGHGIDAAAKRLMVLVLFLIGTGLSIKTLKQVGPRPLFQGIILWIIVGSVSLLGISYWVQ